MLTSSTLALKNCVVFEVSDPMALDVKTMCLGALSQAEASGYELQKLFKEGPFGHFLEASYGSIYPALTRLTEEGLVTFSEYAQEGRPAKKVYSITRSGRDALQGALNDTPSEDKFRSEFMFFMSFSELMTADHVSALIEARIENTNTRLAHLNETAIEDTTAGQEFVRGYGRAMLETSLDYLNKQRRLIERGSTEPAPSSPLHSTSAPRSMEVD